MDNHRYIIGDMIFTLRGLTLVSHEDPKYDFRFNSQIELCMFLAEAEQATPTRIAEITERRNTRRQRYREYKRRLARDSAN